MAYQMVRRKRTILPLGPPTGPAVSSRPPHFLSKASINEFFFCASGTPWLLLLSSG